MSDARDAHAPEIKADTVDAPPKQPEADIGMTDAGEGSALPVEKPHAPVVEAVPADAPPEQQKGDTGKDEDKIKKIAKKKAKKAPAHPPYFQMIKEAITALSEKGGSSPYAIAKYMEENHKHVLPSNFRKTLGLQLKNSVSKGKLIKIKASFKLPEAVKKSPATTNSTKTRAARANAAVKPEDGAGKKRKRKSREVSKIENPPPLPSFPTPGASTRGRRSKRSAPPPKAKQLKSVKKTKRVATLASA